MKRKGLSMFLRRFVLPVAALLFCVQHSWADSYYNYKYYYYYAKVNAATASESVGRGKVYVSTAEATPESATSESSNVTAQDPNSGDDAYESAPEEGQSIPFYLYAKANEGYYFDGWSDGSTRPESFLSTEAAWTTTFDAAYGTTGTSQTKLSSAPSDYNYITSETGSGSDSYTKYSKTAEYTRYAYFSPVVIIAPMADTVVSVGPVDPRKSYSGSVLYKVSAGASGMADFNFSRSETEENGTFDFPVEGMSYSAGYLNISYTFTPDAETYGGSARSNSTVLMLQSKATGSPERTITIQADFPAAAISAATTEKVYTKNSTLVSGTAVFDVAFVDGINDFEAAVITGGTGGTWTVTSQVMTTPTNYATGAGKVTVGYSFMPDNSLTECGATLTLQTKSAIGTASYPLALSAEVVAPAACDAKIGDTEYTTLESAIAAAQAADNGSTITLLRDVELTGARAAVIDVTKSFTIDPASWSISTTLTASNPAIFDIKDGAVLTIQDSRSGGGLVAANSTNAEVSLVKVTKGTLVLGKGNLTLTSSASGSNSVSAVTLASGAWSGGRPTAMMLMQDGTISATRSAGTNIYGVRCLGSGSNASAVSLEGGQITVTNSAGQNATGVVVSGSSKVADMGITATATASATAIDIVSDATVAIESGEYVATATTGDNATVVKARGNTRLLGGSYRATASSGSTAEAVHAAAGTLVITDGTFVSHAGSNAYALRVSSADKVVTVRDGSFEANATTTTAFAAYLDTEGAALTATAGSFTAKVTRAGASSTSLDAVGVRMIEGTAADLSGVTIAASLPTTGSAVYGINAAGTLTLSKSTVSASTADGSYAYGINAAGDVTISGSTISSTATGERAQGLTINAPSAAVTVTGSSFTVTGGTNSYGAWLNNGSLIATGSTFAVSGTSGNGGVFVQTAKEATLTNCTVTAEGTSSNALHNQGSLTCYNVTATGQQYGIYVTTAASMTRVLSGHYKGTTAAYGQSGSLGTKNIFTGGYWSSKTGVEAAYMLGDYQFYDVPSGDERTAGYLYSIGTPSNPGYSVCAIYNDESGDKDAEYFNLAEALSSVRSGQTIVLTSDYILPAGDYILPAGATLLVPYMLGSGKGATKAIGAGSTANCTSSYTVPSVFRRLTLQAGAHLTVNGVLELSAQIYADGQWADEGGTTGKYGLLQMEEGATIDLEDGSSMYAWGFAIGDGVINVKKGAAVQEPFQLADWPGGSNASKMTGSLWYTAHKAFFITHYFYQNIECNLYYRPGANALGCTAVIMSGSTYFVSNVKLVGQTGESAMFLMDKNDTNPETWVHRKYNTATDQNVWTINSGANLGSLVISAGVNVNSADFDLPITSNMTIIMNYGEMEITQNVNFLPGSQLIINKEGTAFINGKKIGFFGYNDYKGRYYGSRYSPTWGTTNPRGSLSNAVLTLKDDYKNDAELFAHGTFDIRGNGQLYTTTSGANIHSTNEDAGRIYFGSNAPANGTIYYVGGSDHNNGNLTESVVPAQMLNSDGSYANIAGTQAGQIWGYKDDQWKKMQGGDCLYEELDEDGDETGVVIAYPSAFLEVEENTAPADHAYHAKDNPTRYVIYTEADIASECVWWDAEPKEDGYYVITNESSDLYGAYYYYDEGMEYWKPLNYTITWYNGATKIGYSEVARGNKPKFTGKVYNTAGRITIVATPTKAGTEYIDYIWDGWVTSSADELSVDCRVYSNDDMLTATASTTYYAHYKIVAKQYTIIFVGVDGAEIERHTVEAGTMPECSALPTKTPTTEYEYTLSWSPALVVATAPATYTAVFTPVTRRYTITFANFNGDELKSAEVAYNTRPTPPEAPTRQNDGFYSYDFTGWSGPSGVTADGDPLPLVSGATTYTAVYETTDWTPEYTISFVDYDGTLLQTQYVRFTSPLTVPTDPSGSLALMRPEDDAHTYTFSGWSPALTGASEDATYTAQYAIASTKSYTVTFRDYDGVLLLSEEVTGGSQPTPPADPARETTAQYTFAFNGWTSSAGSYGREEALPVVTADITYTADYTQTTRSYTITWKNGDGSTLKTERLDYGITPSSPDETPTKKSSSIAVEYNFDYWYPAITAVKADQTYTPSFTASVPDGYVKVMKGQSLSGWGSIGTICWDRNITAFEGATFYALAGALSAREEDLPYMLLFTEVTELEAGKPYLYVLNASTVGIIQGSETALSPISYNGFYGTYAGVTASVDNALYDRYMLVRGADNSTVIQHCGQNCKIGAYRGYFDIVGHGEGTMVPRYTDKESCYAAFEASPAAAPSQRRFVAADGRQPRHVELSVEAETIATSLDDIFSLIDTNDSFESTESDRAASLKEGCYDVLGRRLDSPIGTGVYIINGKKTVIVK
mgnify:CR=1 FL=1